MTLKKCNNCGKVHNQLPTNSRRWEDDELKLVGLPSLIGWFFECDCKSTMFVKYENNESTAGAMMARLMAIIAMSFLFTGCSTFFQTQPDYQVPQAKLVDPQNRTQAQHNVDYTQCSHYHWQQGMKLLDHDYLNSCMQTKGYALE